MRFDDFKVMNAVQVKILIMREAAGGKDLEEKRMADLPVGRQRLEPGFVKTFFDWFRIRILSAVNDTQFHRGRRQCGGSGRE